MADTEGESIVLTDEDGKDHEFTVIDVLEINGKEYVILLPTEDAEDRDENEDEAIVLRIDVDENGEDVLSEIDDDAEWRLVEEAWQEVLDEE